MNWLFPFHGALKDPYMYLSNLELHLLETNGWKTSPISHQSPLIGLILGLAQEVAQISRWLLDVAQTP